ncbi:MAG: glycosyltransferase family 9 protein [Desulfovibrio sp.]|nr:glycosyltransferase family 9 protein [Desulfovibrio sp.]
MRRILVFQLARFGDLVQSKRLLSSFAAVQNAEVHLCLDQSLLPLARMLYPFATAHGIPAHRTGADAGELFSVCRKTFALFRELNFSSVCFLNFSPLSFACAALFPPEKVIGYARVDGQDMRSKLFGLAFNLLRDRRFSPVNLADLWAFCHTDPIAPEKVNPIAHPAASGRIGIVASGRAPRRSLSPQILAGCVRAVFQARGGPELVCLGTAEEASSARALKRELPARCAEKFKDLTGKTALADLPDILRGLDVLLTPDTGVMHLAAHLGVPVQAFFLSSAWCFETGPYGMGHSVWQARESCSPCLESSPCPRKTACLQAFAHPSFLARLAGKYREGWPENLLGLVTMPDDVGVACKTVDGVDPCAEARAQLRAGLAECLGLPGSEAHPAGKDAAGFLFREKDWMPPGDWEKAAIRERAF